MKMKKSDISLRGKIQHQKDVGYNLMDKYLGALAGLADVKPEVSMTITELEALARAATPGEWSATSIFNVWSQSHLICSTDDSDDSQYIAAANSATMLKLCEIIRELREALEGVIKVADRKTEEFDIAREALAKASELGVE